MNSPYFKLYRTYSNSFNSSNVGKFFWSWILRDCIKVQDKEKESHRLVFTFSTKREFRHFHIVIMQQRQINVQKSMMHKQSCCFANLNQLLLWCSHCRRCRSCLSSLLSRIAPWDVLGDELWPSFLGNLVIANERSEIGRASCRERV